MSGGEAGERANLFFYAMTAPTLFFSGIVGSSAWLWRNARWSLFPIAGTLVALASRTSKEQWRGIGTGILRAAQLFGDLQSAYHEAHEKFQAMAPEIPSWDELAPTVERNSLLLRACLHTLARSPKANLTAKELAQALPELPVGRGEQRVREVLRANPCFHPTERGKWQVGLLTSFSNE